MNLLRKFRSSVRHWWRRAELERSLQDEMQLHIELYEADLHKTGIAPEEAHRRARAAFGSVEARKDECREVVGVRLLDEVRADVNYALRLLRRSPAFTAVALFSLGLGIGANTAIFAVIDRVLLKALPVEDPQTLFFVDNSGGKSQGNSGPPYPCFELLRDQNTTLSHLAAFDEARFKVTIDGTPEEVPGQYASGNFFELLGVQPLRGRLLRPSDDSLIGQGGPDGGVAVISHGLWQRRFGLGQDIIGRLILVGTRQVTIVGVTPPEFFGLQVGTQADITVPITLSENNLRARELWWFSVIARLRQGVSVEQARAELDTLWDGYMTEIGQPREKRTYFSGIALVPAARGLAGLRRQLSEPLVIVMGIVAVVLLIGCANVANLLLARTSAREHELSLRLAVGASRGRLIRQLVTEGVVLSVCGTLAGLIFARWSATFLVTVLARADDGNPIDTSFDGRVLTFAALTAVLAALLFSLAPAIQATRVDAAKPPATGATSPHFTRSWLGQSLIAVQVTLAVVLLSGAALFVQTLKNLHALDPGFQTDGVMALPIEATMPRSTIAKPTAADIRAYHTQLSTIWRGLLEELESVPGITSASIATMTPLTGRDRGVLIAVNGMTLDPQQRGIHVNHITPDYFAVLEIDVTDGRRFTDRDRDGAMRVAILNQTAAREYFGTESPIGRRVSFPGQRVQDEYEIVGVVRDVRYESLRTADERMAYLPIEQAIDPIRGGVVVVRGKGDVVALAPSIREIAARRVPGGFIPQAATLSDRLETSLTRERLLSMLASFFGGLALLLACLGLYGVLAYTVVRRTREIGIRLAIGANKGSLIWTVVRETTTVVVIGVVIGVAAAMAAGRLVRNQLFEVSAGDPLAVSVAVGMLLIVAVVAGYLPARRATRVDPVIALRYE